LPRSRFERVARRTCSTRCRSFPPSPMGATGAAGQGQQHGHSPPRCPHHFADGQDRLAVMWMPSGRTGFFLPNPSCDAATIGPSEKAITAIPFTGLIDADCRFTVYSRSSTNGPVPFYISTFVLEVKVLLFPTMVSTN